jgi:hypothetical protein
VSPVNIKKQEKLFGRDVIISHRLLKNNIKNEEYILLSEAYLSTQDQNELSKIAGWEKVIKGKIDYEHLGTLNYFYLDISDLKNTINIIEPSLPKDIGNSKIKFKIYIDTPPDFVLGIITNFKFKPNWITILQDIQFNERTIPRIGGIHKCLMSDIFFKPVLIDYQSVYLNKEKTKYIEKLSSRLINFNAFLSYNIKSVGLGTILQLELRFSQIGFYPTILRYFFERKLSKRRIRTSLNKLKYLCETIYNKYFSNYNSSAL